MTLVTVTAEVVELLDKNKAKFAFLAPLVTACGTAVVSWIVSGEFNANEIRTAVGGAVLAVVSGAAAYLAPASSAKVKVNQ